MKLRILALLLLLFGLGLGSAQATDGKKMAVSLYLGENTAPADGVRVATERLHHRLHAVFGFSHFELIQTQDIPLAEDWEHWFVPRKDCFMSIRPLKRTPMDQTVAYSIYQEGFVVANGRYELHHDTPLFINGPDLNGGRLIFVVDAKW